MSFAFEAEVLTRNLWSLPCRVAGQIIHEETEAGRSVYAQVEHVEALDDVYDSDERLVAKGDDVTTLLDKREIERLQRQAETRYERDRIGPLSWQYARAF
jgi:hypothetical protein